MVYTVLRFEKLKTFGDIGRGDRNCCPEIFGFYVDDFVVAQIKRNYSYSIICEMSSDECP